MAYIYEYIRTRGFEPIHFEEHYARLNALSERLFGRPLSIAADALRESISNTLRSDGYSPHTINCVCVRCLDNGELRFETIEILYDTFSLRAIRPQGYICHLSGDMLIANTSAKDAMLELNRSVAQSTDAVVPIWVDEQNRLLAIDGAPIAAIFEDEIRFSDIGGGVEFDIAIEKMASSKRKISKSVIKLDELMSAKELLYIDHRGVTALAGWREHTYMDITAERIARKVAETE